ncbi:MAG: hypothetical protein AAFQ89_09510 [Cyanobacteria bacterium J06626_18]
MAKLFVRSLTATAVIAASFAVASAAMAQNAPSSRSGDVPEAINEIYYGNTGPYSNNRSVFSYGNLILGTGGFPERRVMRDARAVSEAIYFLMEEQATSTPTIRVPDLFNPYNTSVQFLPAGQPNVFLSGSEFIFETSLPTP